MLPAAIDEPVRVDQMWIVPVLVPKLDDGRDLVGRHREHQLPYTEDDVLILDGHVGPGYAENTEEDFEVIRRLASTEGLFLDPVYSGKAMKGLLAELDGGRLAGMNRILFIHTGGIFGLFPKADELVGRLTP